jgi:hypothetical protein
MLAFTNHALDHLLSAVVEAGITKNIVRLGSRSANELIAEYSLDKQEMAAGRSRMDRAFARNHRELKEVEEELKTLMKLLVRREVDSEEIVQYLETHYPEEYEHFQLYPPAWISALHRFFSSDDGEGQWQRAGARGAVHALDSSLYAFWRAGRDLEFLKTKPKPPQPARVADQGAEQRNQFEVLSGLEPPIGETPSSDDGSDNFSIDSEDELEVDEEWRQHLRISKPAIVPTDIQPQSAPIDISPIVPPSPTPSPEPKDGLNLEDLQDPAAFFRAFGFDTTPALPLTDRPIHELLEDGNPWSCSLKERERLHQEWCSQVKISLDQRERDEFEALRKRHAEVLAVYQAGKNEVSFVQI